MSVSGTEIRASRVAMLFGGLVIATIIVGATASAIFLRHSEIDVWRKQMSNLSLVLAEHASQTVFAANLVLDSVTERVSQAKVRDQDSFRAKLATPEIYEMLREKISGLPQIDVASVIAANGDNINFSRSFPVPKINLAERDYFKAHRDNPQLRDFISAPVRNKGNGKWTFYISRRLSDVHGNFLGLVLVGVSVDAFTGFYERVARNLGEGATISLFRDDLTLLTRWPHKDDVIGKLNRTGSAHEVINVMKKSDDVLLLDTPRFSTDEAMLRLSAVRKVERYPLVSVLVVADDLFLASWRRSIVLIAGVAVVAVIALLFGLFYLVRNLQRREADMAQMQRLKQEAEAASIAKTNFLATISHEIRTPMNGVLGMTELLLETELDSTQREYAETVLGSGRHLLAVISDVLDFSKIEAGHMELEQIPFDPRGLIDELLALYRESARRSGLALNAELSPQLPALLLGDPVRLRQILVNFIGNAIKFTETGSVEVRVKASFDQSAWRFSVKDTGPGLGPDAGDWLFQAFSQADGSITRRFGGTGLGLAICKRLVELMQGKIGVDSVPGRGAEFWFEIPLPTARESAGAAQDQADSTVNGEEALINAHVLVADDNAINLRLAQAFLKKFGCSFELVENGLLALAAVEQKHFDVVLMDCMMPEMDGYEATRRIRQRELEQSLPRVPIIAMTAKINSDEQDVCLAAGMDDYLSKPYSAADFREKLRHWAKAGAMLA